MSIGIIAQTSSKKSIKIEEAKSSSVNYATVKNDKILVTGFNFFGDSQHYYSCLLDTNLNIIHYINHREIDDQVQSGFVDLMFTDDGGYLISKMTGADSVGYDLFKYDINNELDWFTPVYSSNFKFVTKIIETDTSFFMFGTMDTYVNDEEDFVYQVFVDEVSSDGEYKSTKILYEKAAYLSFGDAIVVDSMFVVSYTDPGSFSSTTPFYGIDYFNFYDRNFNVIDSRTDVAHSKTINYLNDNFYFSTKWIPDPDLAFNLPRHLVRKMPSDLEIEWTNDYIYPPFSFTYDILGLNGTIQEMWPDPRGGFYLVGDISGKESHFSDNPTTIPFGPLTIGTSLIKIDEEGNEIWSYVDDFDYIVPKAAATLSSGNVIIVGEGQVQDEDGIFRRTVTAIKLDKDGCHEPGCRESVSVLDIGDNRITISPNPSEGMFAAAFDNFLLEEILVTDINGSIVYSVKSSSAQVDINITNYPSGIYNATFINSKKEAITKRLVKK